MNLVALHLLVLRIVKFLGRSILFVQHGVRGILYRINEHLLVSDGETQPQIIRATSVFHVSLTGQHFTFMKGEIIIFPPDELTHIYSTNSIVEPTSEEIILPLNCIKRKVMLFPDPENIDLPSSHRLSEAKITYRSKGCHCNWDGSYRKRY